MLTTCPSAGAGCAVCDGPPVGHPFDRGAKPRVPGGHGRGRRAGCEPGDILCVPRHSLRGSACRRPSVESPASAGPLAPRRSARHDCAAVVSAARCGKRPAARLRRLPQVEPLDAESAALVRCARDCLAPPGCVFVNASANFAPQNGEALAAATGAIVVAPNYRLGALGFLGHPALSTEGKSPATTGLLDQRAALVWVRDHIAPFGGEPGNVTLAGQSAGAHSVGLHLVSPGSQGLFHRATLQSGSASMRWRNQADANAQGEQFATAIGCVQTDPALLLACLRSKTWDQVLSALPPPSRAVVRERSCAVDANRRWRRHSGPAAPSARKRRVQSRPRADGRES